MIQLTLTLKMATAQVVEASVTVNILFRTTSTSDDHAQPTCEMTPEFKPFTVLLNCLINLLGAQYGRAAIHCRFVQKVQCDMY